MTNGKKIVKKNWSKKSTYKRKSEPFYRNSKKNFNKFSVIPPPSDSDEFSDPDSKSIIFFPNNKSDINDKNKRQNDDDEPAFLIIPLNDESFFPEINVQDADDFPITGRFNEVISKRKRQQLRLAWKKEETPESILQKQLAEKIKTSQKDVDDFNNKNTLFKYPLRDQILLTDIPVSTKSTILNKFDENEKSRNSFDQSKFMNWVKDLLLLPFNKSKSLPMTLDKGHEEINKYINKVKIHLDNAIAGQDNAKEEIIDFIARIISNPDGKGNILALNGKKGTGKTRLIRKGVAEALERPFHVINLGGMNDVHVLNGHDVTYTGAKYGRLAQILMTSQCNNPVIYLDEIDKIQSGSDKGMEIFRILTHVLDEEQNHEFFDEYFAGIPIDLSKVLFVASLNDPENIDPILRDRLKIINVKELNTDTKVEIVKNYIMPELCQDVKIAKEKIEISDEIVKYVINHKVEKEEGCRQVKKIFETIVQKLNKQRITKTEYFKTDDFIEKIILTEKIVDDLLRNNLPVTQKYPQGMYT